MNNSYVLLFGAFALLLGYKTMTGPVGVRNNNPLNIKFNRANNWVGQVGASEDGIFVKFVSSIYGFRAAMKVLNSYRRRGVVTLEDVIAEWAPPHENPHLETYINYVSKRTKIGREQKINKSDYPALMAAMSKFETGQEWSERDINFAYDMV